MQSFYGKTYLQIFFPKSNSSNDDGFGFNVFLNFRARDSSESILDFAHVLSQFLPENRPVCFDFIYNAMSIFVGTERNVPNSQFFHDIVFEVLDIVQVLLVFMDDDYFS